MQAPTNSTKQDKVRDMVLNLSRIIDALWSNKETMARIRRFAPDRLEEFWCLWDALDIRLREFMEGSMPWSETREIQTEIAYPNAQMRNSHTGEWEPLRCRSSKIEDGPDVMNVARSLLVLVTELLEEYGQKDGLRE